jgi:hypothetical protein
MPSEYAARRQHTRVTFRDPVSGAVTASHAVNVLDLSLGGARVEHTNILRPGSSCHIRVPLNEKVLTVNSRIVWSKAIGRTEAEAGETGLLYQSGVQFGTMAQDSRGLLAAYLDSKGG